MISDKRLESNRRNAQRSTGPRTAAGKEKSRGNSLKHGLTGSGIVVAERDAAEAKAAYVRLAEVVAPANAFEALLVERMALSSVRMNRYERVDRARRNVRKQRALRNWHARQERAVDEAIAILAEDAEAGYQLLTESSLGCQWLADQWRALGDQLERVGHWTLNELMQAIRLQGKDPYSPPHLDSSLTSIRMQFLATQPALDFDFADALVGLPSNTLDAEDRRKAWLDRLPQREAALAELDRLVAASLGWMLELQERVRREVEEPEQADHATIAEIDSSPAGMRLARYDTANEQSLHRNWNILFRLRKQGPETVGIQSAPPAQPSAQNEPNEEPSNSGPGDIYVSSPECASGRSEGSPTPPRADVPVSQPSDRSIEPPMELAEGPEDGPPTALEVP